MKLTLKQKQLIAAKLEKLQPFDMDDFISIMVELMAIAQYNEMFTIAQGPDVDEYGSSNIHLCLDTDLDLPLKSGIGYDRDSFTIEIHTGDCQFMNRGYPGMASTFSECITPLDLDGLIEDTESLLNEAFDQLFY